MYTYYIKEFLMEFDDDLFKTHMIKIHSLDGKFEERAMPIRVRVTDGSTVVNPIMQDISGNGKTLTACFTVDAFTSFSGTVDIEFGYAPDFELITVTNINAIIQPLDSLTGGVAHLIADNAWLASL